MRNKSYLSRERIVYEIKRAQNHSSWLLINIDRDQWERSILLSTQGVRKEASSPETSSFLSFLVLFLLCVCVCVFSPGMIFFPPGLFENVQRHIFLLVSQQNQMNGMLLTFS